MSVVRWKTIFKEPPTFSDKPRSTCFTFSESAGVIGGLVEATSARSDKDHVAELHQLHSAAAAEKLAVVDHLLPQKHKITILI